MRKTQDDFCGRLKTELEKFDAGKNFPERLNREYVEKLLTEQAPEKKKKAKVILFGKSGLAIAASVALLLTAGIMLRFSGVFDSPDVSPAQNSAAQSAVHTGSAVKRADNKLPGGDNTDAAQAQVTNGEKDAHTVTGAKTSGKEDTATTGAKDRPVLAGSKNLNAEEVVSYFNNEGNNPDVAKIIEQAVIAERSEETTTGAEDLKNSGSAQVSKEDGTAVTAGDNTSAAEPPELNITRKAGVVKSGSVLGKQSESDTAELRLGFGDGFEFDFTKGLYRGVYYGADMQLYRVDEHIKESDFPGVFDMTVYINGKALSAQAAKGRASYVCYEQSSNSDESADDISVSFEITFDSAADAQSFAASLIENSFKYQTAPACSGEFFADGTTVMFVW